MHGGVDVPWLWMCRDGAYCGWALVMGVVWVGGRSVDVPWLWMCRDGAYFKGVEANAVLLLSVFFCVERQWER